MTIEKYNQVFVETFGITNVEDLAGYIFKESPNWDSVGHMMLCAAIEDTFGIQLEGEDILNITSYEEGKKVLYKYGIEL